MRLSFRCFDSLFYGLAVFSCYGGGFLTLLCTCPWWISDGWIYLSFLGFRIMVGLLDMHDGSFGILTVFGVGLVFASWVVGSCTTLGSFLLQQEFSSVVDVSLCCSS